MSRTMPATHEDSRTRWRYRRLLLWGALLLALPLGAEARAGEEVQATLRAGEIDAAPGDLVDVTIELDGSEIEPTGVSMGLGHDDELLTLEEIVMGSAVQDIDGGNGPEFWVTNIEPVGGTGGYLAFIALVGGDVVPLPSEDEQHIASYRYTVDVEAELGDAADLEFTEELAAGPDSPPVAVQVVNGIEQTQLTLEDGEVAVLGGRVSFTNPPGSVFVRGDINGSGTINISDAVVLLSYGFSGGDEPPCMDAADVDDNGSVTNLADPLTLLQWLFLEAAAPPPPGSECGIDPTNDTVRCELEPDHCADAEHEG